MSGKEAAHPTAPLTWPGDLAAVRDALRVAVLQGLRPITLGLAGLFVLFAYTDGRFLGPVAGPTMRVADLVVAMAMALLFLGLRSGMAAPQFAHGWALVGALFVLADAALSLAITMDPYQSMGLVLLQLGCALIFLSWSGLAVVLALSDAAWLWAAMQAGMTPAWVEMGTLVAASTVLAPVSHGVRIRTLARLELMRQRDRRVQADLRKALAAEEQATALARASQERFRRVAEATFEGICIHDGARVLDANPVLGELLGVPPSDLVGRPILELVAPESRGAVAGRLLVAGDDALEAWLVRPDGGRVPVEMRGRPIPNGHAGSHVLAVRDLRTRERAEQATRLASERLREIEVLKEVNAFKTQFINMASHELKTPLTPIMLQVGLLKKPDAWQDQARHQRSLDILSRNLDRLKRLVGDVLESGRIQADRMQVTPRPVDVEALARDAVESVGQLAGKAGIAVETELEPGLWAQADADRLHQVLLNLLSNALKFTPPGGTVCVRARRSGGDVLVQVSDTGLGIRAEDMPKLFQPFSQVHDPMAVTDAGSGLGLYISRGIVEAHGGRIWCESDGLGKGTLFSFCLAVDSPAGGAGAAPPAPTTT